jgi:hypothetical protein
MTIFGSYQNNTTVFTKTQSIGTNIYYVSASCNLAGGQSHS